MHEGTTTHETPADDARLLVQAADVTQRLRGAISRVILGQDDIITALLAGVLAEGHTLLVGVPGLAKTLLVQTLAEALGWSFRRIQFTPDLMPSDITGIELLEEASPGRRSLRFMPGPLFANLVLADEINRTPPKTQAALLEAMQERQVTSLGTRHALPTPFIVVATQNPIEQEGTYPLPEAQLDRFMLSLTLDYPDQATEERIVSQTTGEGVAAADAVTNVEEFAALRGLVRRMPAGAHVVRYAVALTRATRPDALKPDALASRWVQWGAGPRGGQHLILLSKALALMDASPAVTVGHVRQAAPYVLPHRMLLNYHAAGEGLTPGQLVAQVLETVSEPDYAA